MNAKLATYHTLPKSIGEDSLGSIVPEDVRLTSQRGRVSLVLRSAAFRNQLERITASYAHQEVAPPLLNFGIPHSRFGSSNFSRCTTLPILPIDDLQGSEVPKIERLVRCKLASVFRLVDLFHWRSQGHVTARLGGVDQHEFLIEPCDILFNEISASSLIKVDLEGRILHSGLLNLAIDLPGWMLHSAIYRARPEARCVIHLCTPAAMVLSTLPDGLLPLSQEAMIVGQVAAYEFDAHNGRSAEDECHSIAEALNAKSEDCRALIVRNNGILVFGFTIEEAWMNAYTANLACEAQLRLAAACVDHDDLVLPSLEAQRRAMVTGRTPSQIQMGSTSMWKTGELEFEALMRRLDSAGYRTGHVYRLGQTLKNQRSGDSEAATVRSSAAKKEPVTVPPSTVGKCISKSLSMDTSRSRRHWTSTPNAYKKSVIEELGVANPQLIAKWTTDEQGEDEAFESAAESDGAFGSPMRRKPKQRMRARARTLPRAATDEFPLTPAAAKSHTLTAGIGIATEDPNIYAPQGADPAELREAQERVRDRYVKALRTVGPRSRILFGLDDDYDACFAHSDGEVVTSSFACSIPRLQRPTSPPGTLLRADANATMQAAPGHALLVGAVSKGIIKSNVRHNVALYRSVYQPNPFDNVTDEDLQRYRIDVDRKQKGLPSLEAEEAQLKAKQQEEALLKKQHEEQMALEAEKNASKKSFFGGISRKATKSPKSDTSGADTTQDTDAEDSKKEKKKRRFKFSLFKH